MDNYRVAVTGLGTVTALGDLHTSLETIKQGLSGIGRISRFDAGSSVYQRAAEVKDFDPRPFFRVPKAIKLADLKTKACHHVLKSRLSQVFLDAIVKVTDEHRFESPISGPQSQCLIMKDKMHPCALIEQRTNLLQQLHVNGADGHENDYPIRLNGRDRRLRRRVGIQTVQYGLRFITKD